jgi:hypothetical protein
LSAIIEGSSSSLFEREWRCVVELLPGDLLEHGFEVLYLALVLVVGSDDRILGWLKYRIEAANHHKR